MLRCGRKLGAESPCLNGIQCTPVFERTICALSKNIAYIHTEGVCINLFTDDRLSHQARECCWPVCWPTPVHAFMLHKRRNFR